MDARAYFNARIRPRLTAEVVYGDLGLRWRGGVGHCACPLHGGDDPFNFTVWADRLNWFCRRRARCDPNRGEVLDYIRRRHRLSERDAIAYLARLARGLPARRAPPPAAAEEAHSPPPAAEVRALWAAAGPVTADREAVAWLGRFALDPARVARLDLARVLPRGPLPPWAAGWASNGFNAGYRLLMPVFDPRGRLASLRARLIGTPRTKQEADTKERAPTGHATAGLILADPWGRRLLAGDPAARRRARRRGVEVAEGTKDLLTLATEPEPRVLLAVFEGSWRPEHAARVPNGAAVTISTDADEEGNRYAGDIGRTLRGRSVELRRRHWNEED